MQKPFLECCDGDKSQILDSSNNYSIIVSGNHSYD